MGWVPAGMQGDGKANQCRLNSPELLTVLCFQSRLPLSSSFVVGRCASLTHTARSHLHFKGRHKQVICILEHFSWSFTLTHSVKCVPACFFTDAFPSL